MIRSREVGLFNAYSFALAAILSACFWGTFFLLQVLGVRDLSRNFEAYLAYNLISIGGLMLQLYQTDSSRVNLLSLDPLQNLQISTSQMLHVAGALTVMLVLTKDAAISRLFLVVYLVLLQGTLLAANAAIPRLLSQIFFTGNNQIPALLVGRVPRVGRMRRWLRRMESYGINVVGLLTEEHTPRTKTVQRIPIVGDARDLACILGKIRIETVVLLDVPREQALLDSIIAATDRAGVRMIVLNNLSEIFKHSLQFYRQFGTDFIALRQEPLQDPLNRVIKRMVDITLALPAVVLLLPPLALFVWIAQRTQSPGPLFFRQTRAGIQNRRFEIIKFRSMHLENPDATKQATENDVRVFTFGRLLRKYSIDEIPQFLNVLRGEMSLVGPRPHMLEHNEAFAKVMAHYHVRTFVKPGVTGLAQVRGFRGEAHTADDIRKRVECDVEYIERWSLLLDIAVILKTAIQLVRPPKSAY
jgi:putative colanic acid biosynthesis UDP-glucose lipid carrier transferase